MATHERKCWDCGNVAHHEDNGTPHVLCKRCGSQDTRATERQQSKKPHITLFVGDDYCIIWNGDKQIFCYHGTISSCVHQVCSSLGVAIDSADAKEGDFDWEIVHGMTLTEFNEHVRERRAKATAKEVKKLEAELKAKRNQLAAMKAQR